MQIRHTGTLEPKPIERCTWAKTVVVALAVIAAYFVVLN